MMPEVLPGGYILYERGPQVLPSIPKCEHFQCCWCSQYVGLKMIVRFALYLVFSKGRGGIKS